jgi:hypothetical protein
VDFFRKAVLLQKEYADGKHIENSLQTNGILLNDEWGRFLSEAHFLVGVSIDGPEELHDCYRRDKGEHSSFERVLQGLEVLKWFKVLFNTLTCVHRENSKARFLSITFSQNTAAVYIQFILIVERASPVFSGNRLSLVPRALTYGLWSPSGRSTALLRRVQGSRWTRLPSSGTGLMGRPCDRSPGPTRSRQPRSGRCSSGLLCPVGKGLKSAPLGPA